MEHRWMTQRALDAARHMVLAWLCLVATGVACHSPTAPTPPAEIFATRTAVRPGDTVTFVLAGFPTDQRILWQFTTSDLTPVAFVPVVADVEGASQAATDTHRTTVRVVRVAQPTRFVAEAWSIPGFGDNPPAALIASLGIDALP
jgi:hypothetical protein